MGLKALVKERLGDRPGAELVLSKHEHAPETRQAPLTAELAEAGTDCDLVTAAIALLELVDDAGGRAGKYTVNVREPGGVQIGDANRQDNVFNTAPES